MIYAFFSDNPPNEGETTVGLITEFNMWDYEMSVDEISSKTCGTLGNVASWTGTSSKWGTLLEKRITLVGSDYNIKCFGTVYLAKKSFNDKDKMFRYLLIILSKSDSLLSQLHTTH